MNTQHQFAVTYLLLVTMSLTGCRSSKEAHQPTQTAAAVKAAIAAMPQPAPKLYLDDDSKLFSNTDSISAATTTYYLYGERKSLEWMFQLGSESLKENFTYNLVMASYGNTSVAMEIILKQGQQETILGQDTFTVDSNSYQPYHGQISGSTVAVNEGDQIILRLTVSGDDFGMVYNARSSVDILKPSIALSKTIAEERKKALTWVAINTKGLDSDVFTNFRDRLDEVVLTKSDAKWWFGWGLTKSGKPYLLDWSDGVFSIKKISIEEAKEKELGENLVLFNR
jgi:hypothetical protein